MSPVLGQLKAVPGPRWGAHPGWRCSSSDMAVPFTGVWQQIAWEQIKGVLFLKINYFNSQSPQNTSFPVTHLLA